MRRYDFDGVDVDWEYPGGGAGNPSRPEDPQNLTRLLAELRRQFDAAGDEDGRTYELSFAASANPTRIDQLDVVSLEPHVDFVNVMTYDFAGPWSDITAFNSPLRGADDDPRWGAKRANADYAMRYWHRKGVPKEKLHLGLAFYARSFVGVLDRNDGLFQSFDGPADDAWAEPGMTDYRNVVEALETDSSYRRYWHGQAEVPWAYSASDGVFVTYDDPRSIGVKTTYAHRNGFGGVAFWEFYGDRDEQLLDAVRDALSS